MLVGGGLLKMCELDITDNTIFGHCSNCGECCTDYLIITDKELKAIKKYLKHHPEIHDMTRPVLCPFRDPIRMRCQIYEVRPEICRRFLCHNSLDIIAKNKKELSQRKGCHNDGSDLFRMVSLRELLKSSCI
jgi:hypothetical protein